MHLLLVALKTKTKTSFPVITVHRLRGSYQMLAVEVQLLQIPDSVSVDS